MAVWGLWFTTALTEPAGFMACPMHSGVQAGLNGHNGHGASTPTSGAAATPASDARMLMSHDMSGDMSTQMSTEMSTEMSRDMNTAMTHDAPPSSHQHCTCLGDCCALSVASVPVAPTLPASVTVQVAHAPPPVVIARPMSQIDYVLPFANGPPVRV